MIEYLFIPSLITITCYAVAMYRVPINLLRAPEYIRNAVLDGMQTREYRIATLIATVSWMLFFYVL